MCISISFSVSVIPRDLRYIIDISYSYSTYLIYISIRQSVHHNMIQGFSVDKICIQKANLVGLSNVVRVGRFCYFDHHDQKSLNLK